MRRVTAVLFAPVLTVAALAGCGGDDDDSGPVTPRPTTTPSATPAAALVTEAQARAALLTAAEAGPGYALDTDSDSEDDDFGPSGCPAVDAAQVLDERLVRAEPSVEFTAGEQGPFLAQEIDVYASAADARRSFAAGSAAFAGCPTLTLDMDGTEVEFAVTQRTAPAGGRDAAAFRLTAAIQDVPFAMDTVVVLVGNAQVSLLVTRIGEPGPFAVEAALVRKALAKLRATASAAA